MQKYFAHFLKISCACSMLQGMEGASSFSHRIFIRLKSLSDSSMPTRNQNTPSGKNCGKLGGK